MTKIKISAVSYLNAAPFIYGMNQTGIKNDIELSLDIPSVCADKLIHDKVDVGLIPVTAIASLKESHIITDYCISAVGKVNSVLLFSRVPLREVKTILLDYQSHTSVQLVKILSFHFWHIVPEFKNAYIDYENDINGNTAGLVIGDRALLMKNNFKYSYDLSEAWYEMTSLPFVFACWVANKKIPGRFIEKFNEALKFGVNHIDEVIAEKKNMNLSFEEMQYYLKMNISYALDAEKKKGMNMFLELLNDKIKLNGFSVAGPFNK
ncbi:MAG: menaquinone biosynthesis protein [Bacteroidia bacterium]